MIQHKSQEDIHTKPIEVTTSSSDATNVEQFFFTHADNKIETEEQTRQELATANWPTQHSQSFVNTSQDLNIPSRRIWTRNYLRQLATKTLWQPLMCSLDTCFRTQQLVKTIKQLPESYVTSRPRRKETDVVLQITMKHATTEHAQTIWIPERTHASLKEALEIQKVESGSMWQKYVNLSLLKYNKSFHTSIGCETSRVFHGQHPYNVLDLMMGIRPQKPLCRTHKLPKMILSKQKWSS